ncbi:MAG: hypothetical protein LBE62_03890 [Azonexus sp.]|nr:hypothetical protein [Azonexus sp.]
MYNKTVMILERAAAAGLSRPRLKTTALASAVTLALFGACVNAQAVALGAASVKSALGEPLRAEVEVPQISPEEAADFKATIASREGFKAVGLEYTQAVTGVRVSLHRRANGQAYLRLEGDRPINEPLLSVVINAEWGDGGRLVRDYTMLVDPPARSQPEVAVTLPRRDAIAPPPQAATASQRQAVATAPRQAAGTPPQPGTQANPPKQAAAVPPPAIGNNQVEVKHGDTASSIVSATPIEGVSLDQMLIALLHANPNAFINGNVNLVKAGAVLNLPTAEQAKAIPRQEARRVFVAQVRAFNDYRSGVAQNARTVANASSGRSASGSVQVHVPTENQPPGPRDVVIVGAGASSAGSAEAAVAQSRQAEAQRQREAELEKTRKELETLQKETLQKDAAAAQPKPGASAMSGGIQVPTGSVVPTPPTPPAPVASPSQTAITPPPANTASKAVSAQEPPKSTASSATAARPAAASTQSPKPRPASPAPAPSLIRQLSDYAPLLAGGAGILALIAGLVLYRARQSQNSRYSLRGNSFIANRLEPDSFFGPNGGRQTDIDTREKIGDTSSLAYSPSQIDAAGDVDPVAEAEVYLAYGRDQQAEEILKETLRSHPGRISIYRKLADIYAKRRDVRALEAIAAEAYDVAHDNDPDWQAIAALGNELDPGNPLYSTGSSPATSHTKAASASTAPHTHGSFDADTRPHSEDHVPARTSDAVSAPPLPMSSNRAPIDLELDEAPEDSAADKASDAAAAQDADSNLIDLDLELTPSAASGSTSASKANKPGMGADSGTIEFDVSALSADPDSNSGGELQGQQPPNADDDPLDTKLALAQEFHTIGDDEGARSLVKEVIAEATGSLKERAERFLAKLDR